MKKGKVLESFVHYVYSSLLEMSDVNSSVSRNFKVKGTSGVIHEFDVYYNFFHLGILFQVAIECKEWNRPVSKGCVQEFWAKIDDLYHIAGVMVSKNGYQKGAEEYANQKGILLLTLADLPTLNQLVAKRLEYVLLPDENTIGEPFWTVMQVENGKNRGVHFNLGTEENPQIPLFYSKNMATSFLGGIIDRESWGVRGLSKEQLKMLINLSKNMLHVKFAVCVFPVVIEEQLQFVSLTDQEIEENYLKVS